MRDLPRQLTVDELAGLFEGRTRFVERLAELEYPLGRAREIVPLLRERMTRSREEELRTAVDELVQIAINRWRTS